MIFVLLGKSCSGKTTVLNHLNKINNQNKITAITTRPIRDGEVNGLDYHFIRDEEFLALQNAGEFICVRNYTVDNGDVWRYGFIKDEILVTRQDKFLVVDLDGFKELKKLLTNRCKGIYLDVSDTELKKRGLERGDGLIELDRRLKADKVDFEDVERNVDYIIAVNDKTEVIAKLIMNIVKAHE